MMQTKSEDIEILIGEAEDIRNFCLLCQVTSIIYYTKGQLISKELFGVFNTFKNRTKKQNKKSPEQYYDTSGQTCFYSLSGRIEDTIKCF